MEITRGAPSTLTFRIAERFSFIAALSGDESSNILPALSYSTAGRVACFAQQSFS